MILLPTIKMATIIYIFVELMLPGGLLPRDGLQVIYGNCNLDPLLL